MQELEGHTTKEERKEEKKVNLERLIKVGGFQYHGDSNKPKGQEARDAEGEEEGFSEWQPTLIEMKEKPKRKKKGGRR